jgi:DnaJ-class molecular chaperone
MSQPTDPDHYTTLQVASDATPNDVRRAYRRAAQQHHPDRQPGDPRAQDRMARINEAYAVLSHPERRASYDLWRQARMARQRAQAAVDAARPSRFAATWPWGLVAATMVIAFGTVGTVLYKTGTSSARSAAPLVAGR